MKKWRFLLITILVGLSLSLFFFFVPFNNVAKRIPILRGFYKNTSLEIVTPNGKSTIKIDGKEYGDTPVNIENLVAGTYQVELIREAEKDSFYKSHKFTVEMTKNTTSRINMEIGPGDNIHGFVLYYLEDSTITDDTGQITITSSAEDAMIYLDEEYLEKVPLTNFNLPTGEYTIEIRASNYEDLSFPIVIEPGYILNIKGYQLPIPISFESVEDNE